MTATASERAGPMPVFPAAGPGLDALRTLLTEAQFTTDAVCRRLGIASVYDFQSIREGRPGDSEVTDALDVLIRLYMDVELVEEAMIDRLLGAAGVPTLDAAGLLAASHTEPSRRHATVLLYPTAGLWIASDLHVSPTGASSTIFTDDAVYPAITKNTKHFLSSLPGTPCDQFLELCAGTGIAALLAASYAGHAWAADITARATRFARFNAALNRIDNCTAVQGDLYDAVPGQSFDRIVAHPPYMPSLEPKFIFRDGGEDGEQVTRRIIAGLPQYLRPGGRFYGTCMLTDRKGRRAEARLREMLGEREGEFDVALVTHQSFQPTEYYFRSALAGRAPLTEVVQRHEIFERLEVEHLVYCSMVIERRRDARGGATVRRQAGAELGSEALEWLLRWEAASTAPGFLERLLETRPTASPRARLRLSHGMGPGEWVAEECVLSTRVPFMAEARCPLWAAGLVAQCDGLRTVREHLRLLKQAGSVPDDAPEAEFARMVRTLLAGGFLQLPDLAPPEVGSAA